MKDYVSKRAYLEKIFKLCPVYICKEEDCGLLGAFARTK